uniref:Zinc finger protein 287-like n=1 Tax=Mastacembelus armatus TaxID=205130 RepID=A0A7N8YDC8_9TELE
MFWHIRSPLPWPHGIAKCEWCVCRCFPRSVRRVAMQIRALLWSLMERYLIEMGTIQNNDSNEEGVDSEGDQTKRKIMQGQSGTDKAESPYESGSAKGQKDRRFCHFCGKGFQYVSTKKLITHLKHFHNKAYFCDICGKIFDNKRNLRLHGRMHKEVKKFLCQECGKTFNRKDHLIVHVRTHSGERPYHCDICDKAFSHKQNLRIHKRSHSGERPCHCGQSEWEEQERTSVIPEVFGLLQSVIPSTNLVVTWINSFAVLVLLHIWK